MSDSCKGCKISNDFCYEYHCNLIQGFSSNWKIALEGLPNNVLSEAIQSCVEICGDGTYLSQL